MNLIYPFPPLLQTRLGIAISWQIYEISAFIHEKIIDELGFSGFVRCFRNSFAHQEVDERRFPDIGSSNHRNIWEIWARALGKFGSRFDEGEGMNKHLLRRRINDLSIGILRFFFKQKKLNQRQLSYLFVIF